MHRGEAQMSRVAVAASPSCAQGWKHKMQNEENAKLSMPRSHGAGTKQDGVLRSVLPRNALQTQPTLTCTSVCKMHPQTTQGLAAVPPQSSGYSGVKDTPTLYLTGE